MKEVTEAAKYYLQSQGLTGTKKQVEKLMGQFPGETILVMAMQRGFINNPS